MKVVRRVDIVPVFCEGPVPDVPSDYEPGKLYIGTAGPQNAEYIGFRCFCDCQSFTLLPVNKPSGQGWKLEVHEDRRVTLRGSILQGGCNAHYVIEKNVAKFFEH